MYVNKLSLIVSDPNSTNVSLRWYFWYYFLFMILTSEKKVGATACACNSSSCTLGMKVWEPLL